MNISVTPIANLAEYDNRMTRSVEDKLWFLDHFQVGGPDVWCDYGCADGFLMQQIRKIGHKPTIGYDIDPNQIQACRDRGISSFVTSNLSEFFGEMKRLQPLKTGVILSSVYHEMSHLQRSVLFDDFAYNDVEYVAIRDMATNADLMDDTTHLRNKVIDRLSCHSPHAMLRLEEFENRKGEISFGPFLVHYLLKYRYVQNWARELDEDYLINTQTLLTNAREAGYSPIRIDYYQLPWIVGNVKGFFDIDLPFTTHVKIMLKRFR